MLCICFFFIKSILGFKLFSVHASCTLQCVEDVFTIDCCCIPLLVVTQLMSLLVVLANCLELSVLCLVYLQASEFRSSLIIKPMFSKPVKIDKSAIKSYHFVENMVTI